jgi:hypothetical protein
VNQQAAHAGGAHFGQSNFLRSCGFARHDAIIALIRAEVKPLGIVDMNAGDSIKSQCPRIL